MRSLVIANLADRIDEITEAADGREAWTLLLERTFDLALIDLSMPNVDGCTLIKCMRAHPRTMHMPIVVITSSTDQSAIGAAFEAGATWFLTKPINWTLLGHQIDYLIRSSQTAALTRASRRQAEAVSRAKDAVIAAVASRVRERNGSIISIAEQEMHRAAISDSGADQLEFAARLLTEALSVEEMLDDVMAHVRTITEQIVVDDRPVLVARLVRTCTEDLAHFAEQRRMSLDIAPITIGLRLRCDEKALACALSNLIRNAIEHSPASTSVRISTELRCDNVLAIHVDDEGLGADLEVIARCLMPLGATAGRARDRAEVTTLGLPMAKAIAQAHGGTIEIQPLPQKGTRASLVLPAEIVELASDQAA